MLIRTTCAARSAAVALVYFKHDPPWDRSVGIIQLLGCWRCNRGRASVIFEVRIRGYVTAIRGHVTARGSHNPTIERAAPSVLWSTASKHEFDRDQQEGTSSSEETVSLTRPGNHGVCSDVDLYRLTHSRACVF